MEQIKHLLQKVQAKIELYEKHKELSGENFNIFSIMGMESDEVFTHSAIIAELLNPKGSHGLGSLPLKIFIEQNFENGFDFNIKDSMCYKELHIGQTNIDKTEGGRLDIVVKENSVQDNSEKIFIIENKIYAGEQENQLLRYKNKYSKAKLLFLTLEGSESKQFFEKEESKFYISISYEKNILKWLTECIKHTYDMPRVRETLNQYIYLIKKLTNQTTNEKMSEDIVNIINENFESSIEIYNNFEKALQARQDAFLEKIKNIAESATEFNILNLKLSIEKISNSNRLKLNLPNDFFVSFHFKNKNQPLILIGNSSEEFAVKKSATDIKYNEFAHSFKKPNWKTDNYIFWKHDYNNLGLPSNLLEAEQSNTHKVIAQNLLEIALKFHTKFLS